MMRGLVVLMLPGMIVGQDLFLSARVATPPSVIPHIKAQGVNTVSNLTRLAHPATNSSLVDPFSAAVAFQFVMTLVHGEAAFHVHAVTAHVFFRGAAQYSKEQFVDALMDIVDAKLAEAAGMDEDTYNRFKNKFFLKSVFQDVMMGAWGKLYDDCLDHIDEVTNDHIVEGLSEHLNHITDAGATNAIEQAQTCMYSVSQLMCNYDSGAYNKNNAMCGGYRNTCSLSGCCHVPGKDPRDEVSGNHALYVACCD
jgi:hypothetical protein